MPEAAYSIEDEILSDSVLSDNQETEDDLTISRSDISGAVLYGVDWTVETLIKQMQKGNLSLDPKFQRLDAWSLEHKSRYIESIFLGLPTPQIVLAEVSGAGKFIVIDGKQRLLTLRQFFTEKGEPNFEKFSLKGLTIIKNFNGKTVEDIENDANSSEELEFFKNQTIRTTVVRNWPSEQFLNLLFARINTGSLKLSAQELRQALFPGKFVDYIHNYSSSNKVILNLLNLKRPDRRMRDVELLLRFYAFKVYLNIYSGGFSKFLDEVCKRGNRDYETNDEKFKNLANELSEAIDFTKKIFAEHSFKSFNNNRYESRFNRSVFDIFVYYFSEPYIRECFEGKLNSVKLSFEEIMSKDQKFIESMVLSTKTPSFTNYRIKRWGETLEKIIGMPISIIPQ